MLAERGGKDGLGLHPGPAKVPGPCVTTGEQGKVPATQAEDVEFLLLQLLVFADHGPRPDFDQEPIRADAVVQ